MTTKVEPTVDKWEEIKKRFIDEVRPYFMNAIMQGENGDELRETDLAGDYAKDLFDQYVSNLLRERYVLGYKNGYINGGINQANNSFIVEDKI